MNLVRRLIILSGGASVVGCALPKMPGPALVDQITPRPERFEITRTDAEWRAMLTPARYRILREEGTEPRYSSPLLKEDRAGHFACAGCNLPLFPSKTKYDSGTGWMGFWQPLDNDGIRLSLDTSEGQTRTEVHCRRCGSHTGHVFDNGPPPTGLFYCLNGLSLTFVPDQA